MKKLSRKEINQGLETVPIETLLLGANMTDIKLTKKQKDFAREVVKTGNKSAAYRKAYNTKGKRETAGVEASKLAKNPKVATYIQALEAAKEAETYLLPARLRSIAIHRLTGLALNDEIAPAQQLKALELIGKMTEVALFTERRELIQTTNSETMREQLLNSIRLAISADGATDVEAIEVDSLLNEISGTNDSEQVAVDSEGDMLLNDLEQMDNEQTPDPLADVIQPDPPGPDPLFSGSHQSGPLHSIPHIESAPKSDFEKNPQHNQEVSTITGVTLSINPNTEDTPPVNESTEGKGV